jgi:O-antigen/teichoic acid export membrane protein
VSAGTTPPAQRERPLANRLLTGALWSVAIRWVSKVLGFINLAVCARLLTPADYGVMNMAMVMAGLFTVVANFGIDAALLRTQHCTKEDYDTAWSLKVLQGLLLATLMAAVAPFAEAIYGDARITPLVLCIAAGTAVNGLANIYVIDFQKRLDFRTDFILNIIPRIIAVGIAIALAYWLRNYWALILSICSTYITWTALSYIITPRRPAWSLQKASSFFGFSVWYFMQGLADYLYGQSDRLMLGGRVGATDLGVYSIARETAALPSTEITLPLGRALLPTLSRLNHDHERFAAAVRKTLGSTLAIIAPICITLALTAPEVIRLLLGPQWDAAVAFVQVFAIAGVFGAVRVVTSIALTSLGLIRLTAMAAFVQAAIFFVLLLPAYSIGGLPAVARLILSLSAVMCGVQLTLLRHVRIVPRVADLSYMLRPLSAGAAMAATISAVAWLAPPMPDILSLFFKGAAGSVIYLVSTVVMMRTFSGPDSHERHLINVLMPHSWQTRLPGWAIGR